MTDDIEPVVNMFKEVFSSMGFENPELEEMKEDGLLASESFFMEHYWMLQGERNNDFRSI